MHDEKETRQKHLKFKINKPKGRENTHDCAFLEPLAFPPDLPPVILRDLLVVGEKG